MIFALLLASQPASACGGLFCGEFVVEQTGEDIVFAIGDGTVTTHVQVAYEGAAEEFAWIVPVPKVPTLALSTDLLFSGLWSATSYPPAQHDGRRPLRAGPDDFTEDAQDELDAFTAAYLENDTWVPDATDPSKGGCGCSQTHHCPLVPWPVRHHKACPPTDPLNPDTPVAIDKQPRSTQRW